MRSRLLLGMLELVANVGPHQATVEGVVSAAGVSRGTFYKYFADPEALMRAVEVEVASGLLKCTDPLIQTIQFPISRIACSIWMIMHLCCTHPVLGMFVVKLGWPSAFSCSTFGSMREDIELAYGRGELVGTTPDLALSTIWAIAVGGIHLMLQETHDPALPKMVIAAALRSIGASTSRSQHEADALPPPIQCTLPEIFAHQRFSVVNRNAQLRLRNAPHPGSSSKLRYTPWSEDIISPD